MKKNTKYKREAVAPKVSFPSKTEKKILTAKNNEDIQAEEVIDKKVVESNQIENKKSEKKMKENKKSKEIKTEKPNKPEKINKENINNNEIAEPIPNDTGLKKEVVNIE